MRGRTAASAYKHFAKTEQPQYHAYENQPFNQTGHGFSKKSMTKRICFLKWTGLKRVLFRILCSLIRLIVWL